tara:strand:+ start:1405 stop:1866 length:462 start_codon:yes stop_codon:yes gene_type:complete
MSNSSFKFAKSLEKTDFKIGIAKSKWNDKYVDMLVDSAVLHLEQNNIKNIKVIEVPGTWELVYATKVLLEKYDCDGVISIGVIIRGETTHYDLISENVVSGLMDLILNTSKPVTLGILATEDEVQAEERSNPNKLDKGKEFAQTILEVLNLNI